LEKLATVLHVLSLARRCTPAKAGTVLSARARRSPFLVTQNDKLPRCVGRTGSAGRRHAGARCAHGTPVNILYTYATSRVSQVINATNDRGDVVPFSRAGFTAALSIDNAKFRVRGGELSRRAKSS
jgi:hypothetical protein